jgi:hypothetical protein
MYLELGIPESMARACDSVRLTSWYCVTNTPLRVSSM